MITTPFEEFLEEYLPLSATAPYIDIRGQTTDSTPSTASRRDRLSRDGDYVRDLYKSLSGNSKSNPEKQSRTISPGAYTHCHDLRRILQLHVPSIATPEASKNINRVFFTICRTHQGSIQTERELGWGSRRICFSHQGTQ